MIRRRHQVYEKGKGDTVRQTEKASERIPSASLLQHYTAKRRSFIFPPDLSMTPHWWGKEQVEAERDRQRQGCWGCWFGSNKEFRKVSTACWLWKLAKQSCTLVFWCHLFTDSQFRAQVKHFSSCFSFLFLSENTYFLSQTLFCSHAPFVIFTPSVFAQFWNYFCSPFLFFVFLT